MANDNDNKNPVGRPLKYKTVDELDRAINAYFDMCDPHTQRRVVDCGINEKGETIWREREVMTEQKPYTPERPRTGHRPDPPEPSELQRAW
jgi:hypothetical protein